MQSMSRIQEHKRAGEVFLGAVWWAEQRRQYIIIKIPIMSRAEIHGDYSLGAGAEFLVYFVFVHIERVFFDVGEHQLRARMQDGICCGGESIGAGDDLVAPAYAHGF